MTLPLWGSTLYVASGDNKVYDLSGSTYSVQAQLSANVVNSRGMAVDASGNLYVANVVQSSIVKFQSSVLGLNTTSSSYFLNPGSNGLINGLTFDASNNLYAASTLGILKFANDGSGLSSSYTTPFTGVQEPVSVAFDTTGNMFVTDIGTGSVMEYVSSGGFLATTPTTFATGLNGAYDLKFDQGGNLYVSELFGNRVVRYAQSGGVLSSSGTVVANVSGAGGLAFDASNNLLVAGYNDNQVHKFTNNLGTFTDAGSVFSGAVNPTFLLMDGDVLSAPEPSRTLLLAGSLLGVVALRRRRVKGQSGE